jgi:hypothetical protein
MNRLLIRIAVLLWIMSASLFATAQESMGWSLRGGKPWRDRVGPGVSLAIGGNTCTKEYCTEVLDTRLVGSIAATLGLDWRVLPNLAAYFDLHIGYVNTDYNNLGESTEWEDDRGMLLQTTLGAAFHVPFNGWLDAYLGFGMGFAMLKVTALADRIDYAAKLYGINFEFKVGLDFYLFSRVPTLSLGPLFRIGFAAWPKLCIEHAGQAASDCGKPDAQASQWGRPEYGETPFLIFLGLAARYGF